MVFASFLAWPKPKILFIGHYLLRNQTETLVTQARNVGINCLEKLCCIIVVVFLLETIQKLYKKKKHEQQQQ